jgi:hypothetical protein
MSTQQEIAQRLSYSQALLERGIRVSTAVTMVSAKFGVSRSTAYADVHTSSKTIESMDDGPDQSELSEPLDPATVQAQLAHLFDVAVATNDFKAATQLVKALDTAKRWNGYETSQGGGGYA